MVDDDQKNAVGRPRIFDSVDELEAMINDYFFPEETIGKQTDAGFITVKTGQRHPRQKPTVTGLALHLGFADKSTLYEYRDRPEFSYPIKRSLTRIEQYHEESLGDNNVAGRIFALKNMGWKDKTETELSGGLDIKQVTGMEFKDR